MTPEIIKAMCIVFGVPIPDEIQRNQIEDRVQHATLVHSQNVPVRSIYYMREPSFSGNAKQRRKQRRSQERIVA